jgi:exoribonuclease-2
MRDNDESPPNARGAQRTTLRAIARRAMRERGLQPEFSRAALAQTDQAARAATKPAGDSVRDLRNLAWVSIDNDDSRDLDQLSVAEPKDGGAVNILVAVADVDALIEKGSPIDDHARANTTSVYTAAEIFPMLPEKFSTDLTSLGQNAERLAIVIEMLIGPDGSLRSSDVYRALVVNQGKLAYDSVAAWLDGTAPAPKPVAGGKGLDEQLRIQDKVAQVLKTRRHEHGALALETIEAEAVWAGDSLSDLKENSRNRAKELIEEFMVAANGVTARFLDKSGFPSLRRVLKSPERWERLRELAAESGAELPTDPDSKALESFLLRQRDLHPERFADLSLSVVKLLGRGEYVVELPGRKVDGHFGLAVRDYTHSTAPNRRFPDLITQRLIKAALAGARPAYDETELAGLARHCTQQEDAAAKVERQVRKSAAALLLSTRIGQKFDGFVTGASSKGTWVRIAHPSVEGRLVQGFDALDVGDRVTVELLHTNVERGFIDFSRVR